MSVIHWHVTCSLGDIVGPVVVEHEENGSSIAELTVVGTATAGQTVTINSSAGQLFSGFVDRAENIDNGMVRLQCTTALQRAVNQLTRSQIDSMFSGSQWHPDLSDDEAQGWDYFQDRMKTYFGSINASSGSPSLVPWDNTPAGGSPIIEQSTNTPDFTTLLDGVIFEIEYRVPTYEQATAFYSWSDSDNLPPDAEFPEWQPPITGSAGRMVKEMIERNNRMQFEASRMTRYEVDQLLRSTGWIPAFVNGDSVTQWRARPHEVEQIAGNIEATDEEGGYRDFAGSVNLNPVIGFHATLVNRFESQLIIKGEMVVGNPGGNIKRVRIAREHPGESPVGWKTQLGEPPVIDYQPDLSQWLNAHAAAAQKEIDESHRQDSVTVTAPLHRASVSGSVMKVRHELDADAGTALTSVTYTTQSHAGHTNKTYMLGEIRERAEGPEHRLNTRVFDRTFEGSQTNDAGLVKVVGVRRTYQLRSAGNWVNTGNWVTNVSKASFTMPAPEYDDTSPIEISMSVS